MSDRHKKKKNKGYSNRSYADGCNEVKVVTDNAPKVLGEVDEVHRDLTDFFLAINDAEGNWQVRGFE